MNEQNQFELLHTPHLFFGSGEFKKIGTITKSIGSKILIVASESVLKEKETKSLLLEKLQENDLDFEMFFVQGEPEVEFIDEGVDLALNLQSDVILGIGGGSVIDAGKAISGIAANGGSTQDYMEIIGKGSKIIKEPIPFIAIPTTAGTGSEATKNAVILSKEHKIKTSIRSTLLIPKIALIDPQLMVSLPSNITASSGLDALTQLIESYTSIKSQPITDSLALLGIQKITESLLRAFEEGLDITARSDMALAAYLSGICLTNAGLGAVHGFAGSIGGLLGIPHGVICGALLAPTIEQNIKQMISQVPYHPQLQKYATLGESVSGLIFDDIRESVSNLIGFLKNITSILQIPKLSKFGLKFEEFSKIIENTKKSSSMKYNPIQLKDQQLEAILQQVL